MGGGKGGEEGGGERKREMGGGRGERRGGKRDGGRHEGRRGQWLQCSTNLLKEIWFWQREKNERDNTVVPSCHTQGNI